MKRLLLALLLAGALMLLKYCSSNNREDGSEALLDELHGRTGILLARLRDLFPGDARTLALLAAWTRHNKDDWFRPTSRPDPNDVAYTLNKTRVYICTHSPVTGSLNDVNAAMHVLLHELAHIATAERHHPAAFWDNAAFLEAQAQAAGVYEPIAEGTAFCGRLLKRPAPPT